jgi:hypothetical protein
MKNKLILMAAVLAFTYTAAQENPHLNPQIKAYSKKLTAL